MLQTQGIMIAAARRIGLPLFLCLLMALSQHAYDQTRTVQALPKQVPSASLIKAFDLGLHSAVASFLWVGVRSELPFLPDGPAHFFSGLALVNGLDPRFSTPYAFTVLVLPEVRSYADRISAALEIGERGLALADPNWQIPFYMGTIYKLELDDHANAVRSFDRAAHTPGIPDTVRRFAINYGIRPESIAETKAAWTIIYGTSPDPTVRGRAAAHLIHLEIIDYLNGAVAAFHARNGRYPKDLAEVVATGIIAGIPADPFGFDFKLYGQGVVGIAPP